MNSPLRVHLTGGEGIGWALDENLELTRRALRPLGDGVRETSLPECDVLISEDPLHVVRLRDDQMAGKRVISQLDNDLYWFWTQPYMIRAREVVGLWLAQNRTDHARFLAAGLRAEWAPLIVDTDIYKPDLPEGVTASSLKRQWSIPEDKFLIGNFMRDSLGTDVSKPKEQKGVDLFLEIVLALRNKGLPIHILLAGPRRHWIREQFRRHEIPFTYIGQVVEGDDIRVNVLDKATLNLLYHTLDLYLVTSRWESGSRVVLEAAATRCKVLSTRVGLSPDVLEPASLFRGALDAVAAVEREIREPYLEPTLQPQYEKVQQNHTPESYAVRYQALLRQVEAIPPFQPRPRAASRPPKASPASAFLLKVRRRLARSLRQRDLPGLGLSFSLWHEFHKPPYGGGNQFMLALKDGLQRLGAKVYSNYLHPKVDLHVCNSTWFDVKKFQEYAANRPLRMIHRIDGPIALYRGTDRALDDEIFELNRQLAAATVLQSNWSYERLIEMGYRPVRPVILHNAVNDKIFHPQGRLPFDPNRKLRIISSSWSNNVRKGHDVYKWLDENLDFTRFEYTFVGRSDETYKNLRHQQAVPSDQLAQLLRRHDVYLTASRSDPCSNALIEALSCGLPALYLDDGGHPELVGFAGLPFREKEEIPALLDQMAERHALFQNTIVVRSIEEVALTYIQTARQILEHFEPA